MKIRTRNIRAEFIQAAKSIGLTLLFCLIIFVPLFAPARLFFQKTVAASGTGVTLIGRFIFSKKAQLQEENIMLKEQNSFLAIDQAALERSRQRINELESLLGYTSDSENFAGTTARIITRNAKTDDAVQIDRGERNGIRPGSAVIAQDGHLIGIIHEVDQSTSIVHLLRKEEMNVAVEILAGPGYDALYTGTGGYSGVLNFIEKNSVISEGDLVVSSGIDGRIPQGLVIGTVLGLQEDPSETFASATIAPIIDIDATTTVIVLP